MKSLSIILLIIAGLLLIGVGFNIGRVYQHRRDELRIIYLEAKVKKMKCTQYTVLDSERVVSACGDTLKYNWKQLKKHKK